jgi:hypothetical protein
MLEIIFRKEESSKSYNHNEKKFYGYQFYEPLMKEILNLSPNLEVKFLEFEYIDRGIRNFQEFGEVIKACYPRVESIKLAENYSYDSDEYLTSFREETSFAPPSTEGVALFAGASTFWKCYETLFLNLNLHELMIKSCQTSIKNILSYEADIEEFEKNERAPVWLNGDNVRSNEAILFDKLKSVGENRYHVQIKDYF